MWRWQCEHNVHSFECTYFVRSSNKTAYFRAKSHKLSWVATVYVWFRSTTHSFRISISFFALFHFPFVASLLPLSFELDTCDDSNSLTKLWMSSMNSFSRENTQNHFWNQFNQHQTVMITKSNSNITFCCKQNQMKPVF